MPPIVIVGGGIVGVSVAYYLAELGCTNGILLEQDTSVALGASGKAGGFLSRNWLQGALQQIGTVGFDLHADLAKKFPEIDYRPMNAYDIEVSSSDNGPCQRDKTTSNLLSKCTFIDSDRVQHCKRIGTQKTVAQVHPRKLVQAMLAACIDKGFRVAHHRVVSLQESSQNTDDFSISCSDGTTFLASQVVLAMGPWTGPVAGKWLPSLQKSYPSKWHGVLLNTHCSMSNTAIFQENSRIPLEIYPRPDGDTYLCGNPCEADLPTLPSQVLPSEGCCESLHQCAGQISSVLKSADVVLKSACFWCENEDDLPMIGRSCEYDNVFVACGHGCWGILTGPPTGLAIAQLIVSGQSKCIDLQPLEPRRFLNDSDS